jgi:2-polyprenyl-6-methoxyphenol hydroxylase-like FAD-dependent oxidoreductase
MMAGLLFARAGVKTTVIEKHPDFLRDFRGDTVHPSTLRIFHELDLLDRLLERPHDKVRSIGGLIGGTPVELADFSAFDRRWNFIAMMPQWEFLDFVAEAASAYPHFTLLMKAEVTGVLEEEGRVAGVRVATGGGEEERRARLVIAADGRHSAVRRLADLTPRNLGAPIDVFWFRLPKAPSVENDTTGVFAAGRIIVLIDRGDYWQCAYAFPKGMGEKVRATGVDAFRSEIAGIAPMVADRVDAIGSWEDVKLLTVSLDRLERWHRPGLLVIGDAAHAMSPVGGVGINVAIQDAVAAANILAAPLAAGEDPDPLLARVEQRRLPAVRITQGFQKAVQNRIISRVLMRSDAPILPPLPVRLLDRFRFLRRMPAALIGFGYRPERVRSPDAGLRRAAPPASPSPPQG